MSRKMPPIEENHFLTLFLSSACLLFFGGGGEEVCGTNSYNQLSEKKGRSLRKLKMNITRGSIEKALICYNI